MTFFATTPCREHRVKEMAQGLSRRCLSYWRRGLSVGLGSFFRLGRFGGAALRAEHLMRFARHPALTVPLARIRRH